MVHTIKVSNLSVRLNKPCLQKIVKNQQKEIWVSLRIKTSISETQSKLLNNLTSETEEDLISFDKHTSLYYDSQEDKIEIVVYTKTEISVRVIRKYQKTVKQFIEVKEHLLEQEQNQQKLTIVYQLLESSLAQFICLELSNTMIQLLSLDGTVEEMMLQVTCGNDVYRSTTFQNKLFWEESISIFITNQKSINFSIIKADNTHITLSEITFNQFSQGSGFKKILIFNQQKFPIGCLSCDFKNQGQWNYEQTEDVKLLCNEELYKIQIIKMKGKLKEVHGQWKFRVASDINLLDFAIDSEPLNSFETSTTRHLYSCAPKCNFIILCNKGDKKVAYNGAMNLDMVGKFDKKVTIKELDSDQTVGFLLVQTQCLKVDTVTIQFSNIHLQLNSSGRPQQDIFMKGQVGGCFGKTQKNKVQDQIKFIKSLQVKFSKQKQVHLVLYSANEQKSQSIVVSLEGLQQKPDKHIEAVFGDETSFLSGTLNCDYQFVLKDKKSSLKNSQLQLSGYHQNFAMKDQVITKAAQLVEAQKQKQILVQKQKQVVKKDNQKLTSEKQVVKQQQVKEDEKEKFQTFKKSQMKGDNKNDSQAFQKQKIIVDKYKPEKSKNPPIKTNPHKSESHDDQIKVNLGNHILQYKGTKKRFNRSIKKSKSPENNQLQRKNKSLNTSKRQTKLQEKFHHIIGIYLNDKQEMILKKKYIKEPQNKSDSSNPLQGKLTKNEIDLPEIKVYKNTTSHQKKGSLKPYSPVYESSSYFNRKRYAASNKNEP